MAFIQACQGENIAVVPPASVQSDGNPVLTMQTCDFIKLFAAFYGKKALDRQKMEHGILTPYANSSRRTT